MTLNKHKIDGVAAFTSATLSRIDFEQRMKVAGYDISGTVITAYHV